MPGTTPKLALPFPLPNDQVSQGATDIRALAEAVEPWLTLAPVAVLPPAPAIGQRCLLLADAAGGAVWDLVWSGSLWYYLGGAPLYATDFARIPAANAWQVSGPTVHLPYVGIYDLEYGARWDSGGAAAGAGYACPSGPNFAASDSYSQITQTGNPYGGWTPFQGSGLYGIRSTWSNQGGDLTLCYRNDGGSAAFAQYRVLYARPAYITGTAAAGLSDEELLAACDEADELMRDAGLLTLPPELAAGRPA